MFTRDEFLLRCSSYQKGHNRITLAFIVLFFVQVLILNTFNLWDAIRGWPVFAVGGLELCAFLAALKTYEKYRSVRCPDCRQRLAYGSGPNAIRGGRCPRCGHLLFIN
jgi:DNA-directed RNA polymerase subunit RPC12/RpoP